MKYIIDVPDNTKQIDAMYLWHVLKSYPLSELKPYIEPDRKAIEDEVWEFVRTCLVMDGSDFVEAFDSCSYINLLEYSYQEAKEKYEAWLKQKGEIKIGDEVLNRLGKLYVIYQIKNNSAYGVMFDEYPLSQECFSVYDNDKKTGRHFDEVEELLKKMRKKE